MEEPSQDERSQCQASQAGHGVAVASLALAGAGAREWSLLTLGTLMMAARTCRTYGTRRTHRTPW